MTDKKINPAEWAELDTFVHELGAELGIDVDAKKDVACNMSDGRTILVPVCEFNDYKDATRELMGVKDDALLNSLTYQVIAMSPEDFKGYPLA